MPGTTSQVNPPQERSLRVWQWNCNGFKGKKAVSQQHIEHLAQKPDVILLQETLIEETPRLPGYRSIAKPPSQVIPGKRGRGICTLVRKGLTFIELQPTKSTTAEQIFIEIITGKCAKESTYVLNIYCSP